MPRVGSKRHRLFFSFSLVTLGFCFFACSSKKIVDRPVVAIPQAEAKALAAEAQHVPENLLTNHPAFSWPLENPAVNEYFGWRKKKMHEGLDLKARTGTPVFASAPGMVIHAGRRLRRYGNLVIIDHGNGWSSIYAHLSKFKVKFGEKVEAGQLVALSGRTGHATGPHLHFEIRKGSDPLDPLLFLPGLDEKVSARLEELRQNEARGIAGADL